MNEPGAPPTPPPYEPPASTPPPPPPSGAGGGTVSPNRSLMIVLSYLWILAVIPLVVEKEDREVQWHAKHGLVLFVAEIIIWVAIAILQYIATVVFDPLGCVVSILSILLWLGIIVLHILCIVKGVNGQRFIVPGISQYADRF